MNQLTATAIVLGRTDYGEADRIITVLTPDFGKLSLMSKGVKRAGSRLAGGIELFSVSDITFMRGRGEMGRLLSARLRRHYGRIVVDIRRTMLGYELIRQLHHSTEVNTDPEYFELLETAFEALDDPAVPPELTRLWFVAQMLRQGGHAPDLYRDAAGQRLLPGQRYRFDPERMAFEARPDGRFGQEHIKCLRICFGHYTPRRLQNVVGLPAALQAAEPLLQTAARTYLR